MTPTPTIAGATTVKDGEVARAPQVSILFELPAEIRLRIYHYALVKPSPIKIGNSLEGLTSGPVTGNQFRHAQQPALTRVCYQIRKESLPEFYGGSIWRLVFKRSYWSRTPKTSSTCIETWLDIMYRHCPDSLELIRNIYLAGFLTQKRDRTVAEVDLKTLEVLRARCYRREPRQDLQVNPSLVPEVEEALARVRALPPSLTPRRDALVAISEVFQRYVDKDPHARRHFGVPMRKTPKGPRCAYIYSDDDDFRW